MFQIESVHHRDLTIAGTVHLYVKTDGLRAKVTRSKGFQYKSIHSTEERSRSMFQNNLWVLHNTTVILDGAVPRHCPVCLVHLSVTGMCRHYPAKHTKKKLCLNVLSVMHLKF